MRKFAFVIVGVMAILTFALLKAVETRYASDPDFVQGYDTGVRESAGMPMPYGDLPQGSYTVLHVIDRSISGCIAVVSRKTQNGSGYFLVREVPNTATEGMMFRISSPSENSNER